MWIFRLLPLLLLLLKFCDARVSLEWLNEQDGKLLGVPVVISGNKYLFTFDTGSTDLVVSASDQQCCGCSSAAQQCSICHGIFPIGNMTLKTMLPSSPCNSHLTPSGGGYCLNRCLQTGVMGQTMTAMANQVTYQQGCIVQAQFESTDRFFGVAAVISITVGEGEEYERLSFLSPSFLRNNQLRNNKVRTDSETIDPFVDVLEDDGELVFSTQIVANVLRVSCASESPSISIIGAGFRTGSAFGEVSFIHKFLEREKQPLLFGLRGLQTSSPSLILGSQVRVDERANNSFVLATTTSAAWGSTTIEGHFQVTVTALNVAFDDPSIPPVIFETPTSCTIDTGTTISVLPARFMNLFLALVADNETYVKSQFGSSPPEIIISFQLESGGTISMPFGSYVDANNEIMLKETSFDSPCLLGLPFLSNYDVTFFYGDSTKNLGPYVMLVPPSGDTSRISWQGPVFGTLGGLVGVALIVAAVRARQRISMVFTRFWRKDADTEQMNQRSNMENEMFRSL